MPVEVGEMLAVIEQDEFGRVAYEVMERAFAVHNRLGRLFDEHVYQDALQHELGARATAEVRIEVAHGDFRKTYFVDLIVDGAGLFELKTVERLTNAHRAQLLNYLLLTGSRHGKLINFRPARVEHEFVNTSLTHNDRTAFTVMDDQWCDSAANSNDLKNLIIDLLRDWGTALSIQLYEEAITHHFGGQEALHRSIEITDRGRMLGTHTVPLIAPRTTFKISSLHRNLGEYETHLRRLLQHTTLQQIHWINIDLKRVTLNTLSK